MAGGPLLRTESRWTRDLHAPGGCELALGRPPDPDHAAAVAIPAYFGAYQPATIDAFGNWLAGGWFGKRQLRTWFGALGDRLVEVDLDGDRMHVLVEDLDELASAKSTTAVRLLPGFDQYVLGPGTADGHEGGRRHPC